MAFTLGGISLGDLQRETLELKANFDVTPIPTEGAESTIVVGYQGLLHQLKLDGIYTDTGGVTAGAWVALITGLVDDVQAGGYAYHSDFYNGGASFIVKILRFFYEVEAGETFTRVRYELTLIEASDEI